jgi:hypothetical protein
MLGGVTVNFILAFIIYIGMAFAYGDTYIANTDLKDGMLLKIKQCKKRVSKRRQNPGCRWEKIANLIMTST